MKNSQDFIELTARLQKLFNDRDNSYTLCVVIGEVECALLRFLHKINRPLKMREIAEMYGISNAKVTRIIDKLGTKIGYALAFVGWSLAAIGHAFAKGGFGFGVARAFLGFTEAGNFPAAIKTTAEWFDQEGFLATTQK